MRKVDGTRQLSAAAWLALATAFIVMAGQFAVAKHGLSVGLTAYDIVALRCLGAAIPAAAILVRRGARDLSGVGYGRGAFLALIAGSPYALFMYVALRFAPAAHGAMLIPGVGIVVATVIGAAWVGEHHGRGRYVGIGIVLVGLSVLGVGAAYSSPLTGVGDLLLVVGGIELRCSRSSSFVSRLRSQRGLASSPSVSESPWRMRPDGVESSRRRKVYKL